MSRSEPGARWIRAGSAWLWPLAAACSAEPAQVLFAPGASSQERADAAVSGDSRSRDPNLRVWVDGLDGPARSCGTCVELTAHASGGRAPYNFVWTDPTWLGPGPHDVCPTSATSYLVIVSDAEGHFVLGSGALPCEGAAPPSGAAVVTAQAPCLTRAALDVPSDCQNSLAGIPLTRSFALSQPLQRGLAYGAQLTVGGTELTIANGLAFRLYGARSGCAQEQLLGMFELDGVTTAYSVCFVADQAYDHLIAVTDVASVALPVVDGIALCNTGCAASEQ